MAIDEALWRARRAGAAPPTVRFYAWAPPTVSLGYGQPLDDHVDVAACRRLGVGIVRRLTGGSAIYHDGPDGELTYSVVAAAEDIGGGAREHGIRLRPDGLSAHETAGVERLVGEKYATDAWLAGPA